MADPVAVLPAPAGWTLAVRGATVAHFPARESADAAAAVVRAALAAEREACAAVLLGRANELAMIAARTREHGNREGDVRDAQASELRAMRDRLRARAGRGGEGGEGR